MHPIKHVRTFSVSSQMMKRRCGLDSRALKILRHLKAARVQEYLLSFCIFAQVADIGTTAYAIRQGAFEGNSYVRNAGILKALNILLLVTAYYALDELPWAKPYAIKFRWFLLAGMCAASVVVYVYAFRNLRVAGLLGG